MTDTPYTRSLQFNCCKQCVDPETCLATRKEWLQMQLAALSCEICGGLKPDDGDPTCSKECRRKLLYQEDDTTCVWCKGQLATSRGEEGDDVGSYCPNRLCSNSPMFEDQEGDLPY